LRQALKPAKDNYPVSPKGDLQTLISKLNYFQLVRL